MKKINTNVLITGSAGFIGFHVCKKLLELNYTVFGIDNLNNYYDVDLKNQRLKILKKYKNFIFNKIDIVDYNKVYKLFNKNKFKIIIHLAAQAGVRLSVDRPDIYFENNIKGFYNIIQISKIFKIYHLIYASSSSVYGNSKKLPSSELDNTDKPESFYAASKKCNEILAYSYSNIYKIPTTGLRLFTVYGTYGRPDMAIFMFTKSIFNKEKILFNNKGKHSRDFTNVEDVSNLIASIVNKPSKSKVPYQIYNIASSNPISVKSLANKLSKIIKIPYLSRLNTLQTGDVLKTYGDIDKIKKKMKFKSSTLIDKGLKEFVKWYRNNNL